MNPAMWLRERARSYSQDSLFTGLDSSDRVLLQAIAKELRTCADQYEQASFDEEAAS